MVNRLKLHMLFLAVVLGACVPTAWLEEVRRSYPDRAVFQFPSRVAGGDLVYLCAPADTARATRIRARKAHTAYEREIRAYGDIFAAQLVGALKAGNSPKSAARKINTQSDAWARQAALRIEKTYQCLPVSGPGIGARN